MPTLVGHFLFNLQNSFYEIKLTIKIKSYVYFELKSFYVHL